MTDPQIVWTFAEGFRPVKAVRRAAVCAALCALYLLPATAQSQDCSNLPTSFTGNEFPQGDFFTNFDNPCYTIHFGIGNGMEEYGDLNAQYYQLFYTVDPRYQLILVGTFPNARYYSIALYDEHSALSQSILDANIAPLTSQYVNPFQTGVPYAAGQQFAIPINFGGTPGSLETGCMMNGYNVAMNAMDATQRHPGIDWNSDAGFFLQYPNFEYHVVDTPQHTNPNTAGIVMIRAYLDDTPLSYATNPHIIVRDVASGCAYPAAYALNTLQIVASDGPTGRPWLDQNQVAGHHIYDTGYLPRLCDAPAPPPNQLTWSRLGEYVPEANPDASYIAANLPDGLPATLAAAGQVLRIRLRLPATPPTPCTNGCSRSGNEQMRYMSITFHDSIGDILFSLADDAFVQDANGYATLIVGTGAAIPPWVTAANGYTFLDVTTAPNYLQLNLLTMRNIIPAAAFACAGQFIPYRTAANTPVGSLMGDYMPVADYPMAANLPQVTSPLIGPGGCEIFPDGEPGIRPACGITIAPAPAIATVVTECPAPGCAQFAAQPNPPVTITGTGFGNFPSGLPFAGTSGYLRITDTTQNWVAGYTGSACGASIGYWETGRIDFVANPGQAATCPLVAGDSLLIEVWNPQTMVEAQATVKVTAPN